MNVRIKIVNKSIFGKAVDIIQFGIVDAEDGEIISAHFFIGEDGLHYVNNDGEDTVISELKGAEAVYVDSNLLIKTDK